MQDIFEDYPHQGTVASSSSPQAYNKDDLYYKQYSKDPCKDIESSAVYSKDLLENYPKDINSSYNKGESSYAHLHTPSSAAVGGVESAPGSKDWGVGAKDLATPFLVSDILEDPCSRYFYFINHRFLFTNIPF